MTDPPEGYLAVPDPDQDEDGPARRSVVGVWPLHAGGRLGDFRANPDFVPAGPGAPVDPLDALLRAALLGEAPMDLLQLVLRGSTLLLAMNGDGRPLVVRTPDGRTGAVATTSAAYRAQTFAPEWLPVLLADLAGLLPADGDLMINPDGPAPVRLTGDFVRYTAALTAEEAGELADRLRTDALAQVPWEVTAA